MRSMGHSGSTGRYAAPRFEGRQDRHDLRPPLCRGHRDERVRSGSERAKAPGERAALPIELPVGERPVGADDRRRSGVERRLPQEPAVKEVARDLSGGAVDAGADGPLPLRELDGRRPGPGRAVPGEAARERLVRVQEIRREAFREMIVGGAEAQHEAPLVLLDLVLDAGSLRALSSPSGRKGAPTRSRTAVAPG